MSKILTFSRVFPSYHPRKGEPTYFVEAILTEQGIDYTKHDYFVWLVENNSGISEIFLDDFFKSLSQDIDPKSHTIRAHKRPLKVGDWFKPNCWAGRPYNKTKEGFWKIKFAPDIEVKKVWEFESKGGWVYLKSKDHSWGGVGQTNFNEIAKNDGLSYDDLKKWIKYPNDTGEMQIICWNESIKY